jgi:hypothetical protein
MLLRRYVLNVMPQVCMFLVQTAILYGRQPADGLVPASSHPSVSESARPSTVEL